MDFLNKTECHYTWRLFDLDLKIRDDWSKPDYFKSKIDANHVDELISELDIWYLKLTYAYELRSDDPDQALAVIDEVIDVFQTEVDHGDFTLSVFKSAPLHIARSLKAFLLVHEMKVPVISEEVQSLISDIKPFDEMDSTEKAATLASRGRVLKQYGPEGTIRAIPYLREAIRLDPVEPEWKLSLLFCFQRKRHFIKKIMFKWEEVEEAVNMCECILTDPSLSEKDRATTKYLLASVYNDFTFGKERNSQIFKCRERILTLCSDIAEVSSSPLILAFCAERFMQLMPRGFDRGVQLMASVLEKFPNHVGVNTSAANMYRRLGKWHESAACARKALEFGGYGSIWILLQCLVKLEQPFDDEQFFADAIQRHENIYSGNTHLNAALFYFYVKKDVVRGAEHFNSAIESDIKNEILKKNLCQWTQLAYCICPVEIAYNQVVLALKENRPLPESKVLHDLKVKIEMFTDTSVFRTDVDLIKFDQDLPDLRQNQWRSPKKKNQDGNVGKYDWRKGGFKRQQDTGNQTNCRNNENLQTNWRREQMSSESLMSSFKNSTSVRPLKTD